MIHRPFTVLVQAATNQQLAHKSDTNTTAYPIVPILLATLHATPLQGSFFCCCALWSKQALGREIRSALATLNQQNVASRKSHSSVCTATCRALETGAPQPAATNVALITKDMQDARHIEHSTAPQRPSRCLQTPGKLAAPTRVLLFMLPVPTHCSNLAAQQ